MRRSRWLKVSAVGTWAICGLPALAAMVSGTTPGSIRAGWTVAYVVYGVALLAALSSRDAAPRHAMAFTAVQSVTAVLIGYLTAVHFDRTGVGLLVGIGLMVVVAAGLPHLVGARIVGAWIAGQTLAVALLLGRRLGPIDVVTFAVGAAGFQMFASMTTAFMLREAAGRAELGRANAALQATRALLAETSRAAERLRIARDLHDTLGHHLTALSLQLDVASRLANDNSASHIGQAHAVTRLLLAEVRSVVGELRHTSERVDVAEAIRTLAAAAAGSPAIHLDLPATLMVEDGTQATSLVRCVQEIVTNTVRHANARNLWIRIDRHPGGIDVYARDDGGGAEGVRAGSGLTGMRERFAEYSGRVDFTTRRGEGFEIRGFMPIRQVAS